MKQHLQSRMAQRGEGGFTLIELLVVIAILGILSAVVVFAVGNSTDNAQTRACKIERRTLVTAIEAFKMEGTDWPDAADTAALVTALTADGVELLAADTDGADVAERWDYGYEAGVDTEYSLVETTGGKCDFT